MSLVERFTKDTFVARILPRPKGQQLAEAFGWLGGYAAGQGSGKGYKTPATWWRDGTAEPFPTGAFKDVKLRAAHGDEAAGFWEVGASGKRGAVRWKLDGTTLALADLHPDGYVRSYAMGCARGVQVGTGEPKVKKGERAADVGLIWRGTDRPTAIGGDGASISLLASDGEVHVGGLDVRAAMWRGDGEAVVLLGPPGKSTVAVAAGDGEQVGELWTAVGPHAALWSGSEASLVDLNPPGFETSRALSCAGGFQVGIVKQHARTESDIDSPFTRAWLWSGRADGGVDLHACVPAPWTTSSARAIEIDGDRVRIAGAVEAIATHGASWSISAREACVWEARLA